MRPASSSGERIHMPKELPHRLASRPPGLPADDVLSWIPRSLTKAHSIWLNLTYPFETFGERVSIHYSCDIQRRYSHRIRIEDRVMLNSHVWLNIPLTSAGPEPVIALGKGCNLGRGTIISARNKVHIQERVLFAPSVFVTDHNHQYSDPDTPISQQGISCGGTVVIEPNCWLGYGSVVLATKGELVIGRNSVIGAYAVVTESCPTHSVIVGNPSRIVRRFHAESRRWIRVQD